VTTPAPIASPLDAAWVRALAMLALVSTLLGRALAPALPGSTTGLERWILASDRLAAYASQLLLISGAVAGLLLVLTTLRDARLGAAYRLTVAPAAASVVTLTLMASAGRLTWNWSLFLSVMSALVAVSAVPLTLRVPQTRTAGVVLALAAASSLLQTSARVLAQDAGDGAPPSLFTAARGLLTVAFVADAAAVCAAGVWLGLGRRPRATAVAGTIALGSTLLSLGALRGSRYGARLWEVLASRMLSELGRDPAPLVAPVLEHTVVVAAFGAAAVVLVSRRDGHALHAMVALALISGGATDIPLLALCLTLAGLLAPLVALSRVPDSSSVAEPAP
jgi:hypothetical protein